MTAGRTLHGAQGQYPRGFVELASRTWAWLEPNGSWGEANAGIVRGDGESLLVDTLWDAELAGQMLHEAVPLLAGSPLSTALNTHRDGDHWWGNVALPADVQIWTSATALAEMAQEPPPKALHNLARLSRLGARAPGRVGRLSTYSADMLGPFAFGALTPRPPAHSFEAEHTLTIGGRQVRLIHLGPAHTAGDVVAHVPDAGVVFAGDLLFVNVTPVVWAGPASNWVAALDRILQLDAAVYVPGHGPLATREDVEQLRAYWEWFIAGSGAQFGAGRGPGEVMRRLALDPEFGRWRSWLCPERLALNVLARHRELTGTGAARHDPLSRSLMFSQVAELNRLIERS